MKTKRLLDLFCKAGGAAMGYHRAGFEVVGIDHEPQPNYPFEFHQADAVAYLAEHGRKFDAIHASPPCQKHCAITKAKKTQADYPCFIDPTRDLLLKTGLPWIIENVPGAPLRNPIQVCGSAFGLQVRRHRLFESSVTLWGTGCKHPNGPNWPIDVSGTGGRRITRRPDDHGGNTKKPRNLQEARDAMGIEWMTRKELAEAIPPAYTEYLGRQLMAYLAQRKRA
jgi:DNA (cytosine-5)-methyltransferase 1